MNLLELATPELQQAIAALQTAYVRAIDDDELESWPDLFTARCDYRVVAQENARRGLPLATIRCDSRGMLMDRVVSLRNANIFEAHQYRHLVCAAAVRELAADQVRVRSNYVVFRTRTNGVSEVFSTGRYDDLMVVEGARLLFREKIVTFDTNRIDSLLVTPL